MKITIIGAGVMGKIFCQALSQNFSVTISDHNKNNLQKIKDSKIKAKLNSNNLLACKNAEIIILAVKPQSFAELAQELKGRVDINEVMVVSIMAGVSLKKIQTLLGTKKIVRAIPNLGARAGKSMTVWTVTKTISSKEKEIMKNIFSSIGKELFVKNEDKIDKATAISGSGPGFFYYLIEEWIKVSKKFGFTEIEANTLILQTIAGANDLLQINQNPQELRKQVTSKGGTTEAGLKEMNKLTNIMWQNALKAAYNQAKKLNK